MSKFDKFVKNLEKRMTAENSGQKTEIQAQRYVLYFCQLMIPRLRRGMDLQKSWHQVQGILMSQSDINFIMKQGFDNGFSDGFMKNYEEKYIEYNDEDYLFFLFKLLRKYQSSTPDLTADVLSLYLVDTEENNVINRFEYKQLSKEG